jgi:catalase-peroxidase
VTAQVRVDVRAALRQASSALQPDFEGATAATAYYGGAFVNLAFQCAATFRQTDYQGGCNGARVAFSPQIDWAVNRGVNGTLNVLAPIKVRACVRVCI